MQALCLLISTQDDDVSNEIVKGFAAACLVQPFKAKKVDKNVEKKKETQKQTAEEDVHSKKKSNGKSSGLLDAKKKEKNKEQRRNEKGTDKNRRSKQKSSSDGERSPREEDDVEFGDEVHAFNYDGDTNANDFGGESGCTTNDIDEEHMRTRTGAGTHASERTGGFHHENDEDEIEDFTLRRRNREREEKKKEVVNLVEDEQNQGHITWHTHLEEEGSEHTHTHTHRHKEDVRQTHTLRHTHATEDDTNRTHSHTHRSEEGASQTDRLGMTGLGGFATDCFAAGDMHDVHTHKHARTQNADVTDIGNDFQTQTHSSNNRSGEQSGQNHKVSVLTDAVLTLGKKTKSKTSVSFAEEEEVRFFSSSFSSTTSPTAATTTTSAASGRSRTSTSSERGSGKASTFDDDDISLERVAAAREADKRAKDNSSSRVTKTSSHLLRLGSLRSPNIGGTHSLSSMPSALASASTVGLAAPVPAANTASASPGALDSHPPFATQPVTLSGLPSLNSLFPSLSSRLLQSKGDCSSVGRVGMPSSGVSSVASSAGLFSTSMASQSLATSTASRPSSSSASRPAPKPATISALPSATSSASRSAKSIASRPAKSSASQAATSTSSRSATSSISPPATSSASSSASSSVFSLSASLRTPRRASFLSSSSSSTSSSFRNEDGGSAADAMECEEYVYDRRSANAYIKRTSTFSSSSSTPSMSTKDRRKGRSFSFESDDEEKNKATCSDDGSDSDGSSDSDGCSGSDSGADRHHQDPSPHDTTGRESANGIVYQFLKAENVAKVSGVKNVLRVCVFCSICCY